MLQKYRNTNDRNIEIQITEIQKYKLQKKNPAYGRHRISQPMRIEAPIFLFPLT